MGLCLNGMSECPQRYKKTAITSYIRRALSHCSTWKSTSDEIEFSSQMLINDGYSNHDVQKATREVMDKWYNTTNANNNNNETNTPDIKVFYRNQFHHNYRRDEKALRDIITENVKTTNDNVKMKFIIFYSNKKTANLIMKNNPVEARSPLKRRNVVYHFKCPLPGCTSEYIGMTTMTLSKRISCHMQEGNIYSHFNNVHNTNPVRETLIDAFEVIDCNSDLRKLRFLEALHISNIKPSINVTQEPFLLPSLTPRIR